MKKKVYLHIGAHKTGSTALQSFLFLNRDKLIEKGYLYPNFGLEEASSHHILAKPISHPKPNDFIWSLPGAEAIKTKKDILSAIDDELNASGCHSVILSTEVLFVNRPVFSNCLEEDNVAAYAEELLSGYDVVPIVYLRNQVDWIESCYVEAVKGAHTCYEKSFDDFLESNLANLDYSVYLDSWKVEFPKSLQVRSYEATLEEGGIIQDFLKVIECNDSIDTFELINDFGSNISLNRSGVELVRVFNHVNNSTHSENKLSFPFTLEEMKSYGFLGRERYLSYEQACLILDQFEQSNKNIEKTFQVKFVDDWAVWLEKRKLEVQKPKTDIITPLLDALIDRSARLESLGADLAHSTETFKELLLTAEERLSEISRLGRDREELYQTAEERLLEISRLGRDREELYETAEERLLEISRLRKDREELYETAEERLEIISTYQVSEHELQSRIDRLEKAVMDNTIKGVLKKIFVPKSLIENR